MLYALALAVFFVYGRYRLPLAVPLSILGGALLSRAPVLVRGIRWSRLAVAGAAAAAVAVWVFGPVLPGGPQESWFPDYYNQGNRYLRAGRIDEALAEYEKAITVRPGDHPNVAETAAWVVDTRMARGDRAGARRILVEALAVRAGDPRLLARAALLVPE